MNAVRELLRDRRRSQRGSVLSGVLIITAFIAIISGALMTELSGNLLLSRNLMTRLTNEATVNSAAELTISQLQAKPLSAGCPALSPTSLNGLTATSTFSSCYPVVDSRSPQISRIVSGAAFNVDGTHVTVPRAGFNAYIVGDSSGNLYQFSFGSSGANWSFHLPGVIAGRPTTAPDLGESDTNDILTLVPMSASSDSPAACQAGGCVAFLASDSTSPPDENCLMPANGEVTAQPAVGVNNPTVALFGDHAGYLFAYQATENGDCTALINSSIGQPVVAGPVVFAGPTGGSSATDEVYVVTADSLTSWLIRFTFTTKSGHPPTLAEAASLQLPFPNAIGVAADGRSLPARLAIGFAGGGVAVAGITASFGMQTLAQTQLPAGEADSPYWCRCPGGVDRIGVGTADGALYLLDPSLAIQASLPAGGASILSTPSTDSVGDWFFGASDGYVHEVQQASGASLVQVATFGSTGSSIGSAVQVGSCPAGICLYLGAATGAYLVPLDARDAVLTACVTTAPPACSGANPRLWARLEVGAAGNPQTVHIEGWSYYSG